MNNYKILMKKQIKNNKLNYFYKISKYITKYNYYNNYPNFYYKSSNYFLTVKTKNLSISTYFLWKINDNISIGKNVNNSYRINLYNHR